MIDIGCDDVFDKNVNVARMSISEYLYKEDGDDCIAINGNSAHINITGINCGPGHGISVGSLGRNGAHETVEYVYVQHCNFTQTQNGARIKTWPGVRVMQGISTFNISNFSKLPTPSLLTSFTAVVAKAAQERQSSAVQVSNVTYKDINGTSGNQKGIIFNCDQEVCTNIIMDHISIRSSNGGVSNLIVNGSGTIDGRGSTWWNQVYNDQALQFNSCNNLQLSGLTHLNSPRNHISLTACNGASLSYLHISAPASSPNTDGIDISSSTNINIHDSNIATGDDCIAINGNSAHINITGINCGPGHGISVGSLGRNGAHETVEYVYVQHCNFTQTQNGARIKTWPGGSGYARYIYFQHIQLQQASNPIIIDQFYCGGGQGCTGKSSAVQVSNVTYKDINGTSGNQKGIIFNCDQEVCTNIIMDHISIRSSNGGNVSVTCKNVKGQSSYTTPKVPCLSNNNINDDCDNQKRNIFAPTNYLH
ncbi:probable polygalacturonase At3g15720 [Quercus suber]|uniref:probable polygalacturonase At3g15720 n=1 Tax=Quercus suber TaxID=58331 RepID=UPI0032E02929